MIYQNHSLTLYTVKIFCNSVLKKITGFGIKKSALLGLPGLNYIYDIMDLNSKNT